MMGAGRIPFVLRALLIGAFIATGLAAGFIAHQERAASLALQSGDLSGLAAAPAGLRLALGLLLIVIIALVCLIFMVVRRESGTSAEPVTSGDGPAPGSTNSHPSEIAGSGPLISLEAGKMIAAGGLIRRFCHEMTNTLNPIHGYADLLIEDERLSDLHRRHVAKIAQATATALRDVQNIGMALNWSTQRGTPVQLDKAVGAAMTVAESALGARISIAILPGGDVPITASEAEIGQAMLHACSALSPLLAERDMQIEIKVDSFIGQSSPGVDDMAGTGQRLEIWSDPFAPDRTKVQYGALQPSWRYGRVRIDCAGHGWGPAPAGRLFTSELPDDDVASLFMTLLGRLLLNVGGAVGIDTRPLHHANITMHWPARIASHVAAPLEIDSAEDELDALVVDTGEAVAEALSRRLTGLGLRVASTTSAETALELVGEMGSRCRAVLIGLDVDPTLAERVREVARDCHVMLLGDPTSPQTDGVAVWPVDPDEDALRRLVALLRPTLD